MHRLTHLACPEGAYLMSGLVWPEEAAASSTFSSSRARMRSSRRETSCRSPSSRAKKAAEAACTGAASWGAL